METFEEVSRYVESIIRRKTINYSPDIRDDILADAMLKLVQIWPRVKLPVPKEFLKKTFGQFAARHVRKYLNDVHIPQYYADKGIATATDLGKLADRLPELTDECVSAITSALSHDGGYDLDYVPQWVDGSSETGDVQHKFEHVDRSPTSEEIVEKRDYLKKILAPLTNAEYDLLISLVIEGDLQSDIARREGVSREAIRQRVKKAMKKIKKRANKCK